jgi:hypothetical protein
VIDAPLRLVDSVTITTGVIIATYEPVRTSEKHVGIENRSPSIVVPVFVRHDDPRSR